MSDERRTDKRLPLPLEARWESQSGDHAARVSDISLGGCYIETLGRVKVGDTVSFEVQLPKGNGYVCAGWWHMSIRTSGSAYSS